MYPAGLINGLYATLSLSTLLYCLFGSIVGTLAGVLPGIGPLAAISLLLPMTLSLKPIDAMAMLCAIFYGAMYGGSTTSILLRMPGEAASIVTALDGYEMAKKGRAGAALGISAMGSFIAGMIGIAALSVFTPALSAIALSFGPPEYCAIMTLSLVTSIMMSEDSATSSLLMVGLGMLVSCIGLDVVTGNERLSFGLVEMTGGISLVALVIGLFGVGEILTTIEDNAPRDLVAKTYKGLLPNLEDWKASWAPILRGTGLGFLCGILPGGGPVTASFLSYALERRISKHPEKFGTGIIEGVAGPEAANNSAVAGSMIPLLSLGVPSNAVMALLLAALVILGVQPGPLMFAQRPDVFWGVVAAMMVGNVMLLILNLPMVGIWVKILKIPYYILFPIIIVLGAVGSFSDKNIIFDIYVMIAFSALGFVLTKLGYSMIPFILAFVLSPLLEQSLRQSLIMSTTGPMIFVTSPISASIFLLTAVILALFIIAKLKRGRTHYALET